MDVSDSKSDLSRFLVKINQSTLRNISAPKSRNKTDDVITIDECQKIIFLTQSQFQSGVLLQ
uniref:Uncharacterized protein n=1 Tax=Megaselia scalaris TaxID=36166 RepID=T1H0J4_MEGSC